MDGWWACSLGDVLQWEVGRESISRDGNQGDLPRMTMSENKDNTLIRLITSSTLVSRRFTTQKTQRRDGTRRLARSFARSLEMLIVRWLCHNWLIRWRTSTFYLEEDASLRWPHVRSFGAHRLPLLGSRGVCVLMSHAASMRYAGHDSALHVYHCRVNPLLAIQWFINNILTLF